jgi:hypothetical protein
VPTSLGHVVFVWFPREICEALGEIPLFLSTQKYLLQQWTTVMQRERRSAAFFMFRFESWHVGVLPSQVSWFYEALRAFF